MYITIDHASKTIKNKQVLRDVSAGFERGRIYGVVGPNGSGKTMLLRAICGFIRLDAGMVTMNGEPVVFNRKLPDSVGVIIENPGFVLSETGMQNLEYLAGINKDFDQEETERLLRLFDLLDHADAKVKSYSLGMRQKLAIVQALMEHQHLIVLDEPTNGLDQESVAMFLEEIRRQRDRGATVIIASHHFDELNQIADYCYTMRDGVLRAED